MHTPSIVGPALAVLSILLSFISLQFIAWGERARLKAEIERLHARVLYLTDVPNLKPIVHRINGLLDGMIVPGPGGTGVYALSLTSEEECPAAPGTPDGITSNLLVNTAGPVNVPETLCILQVKEGKVTQRNYHITPATGWMPYNLSI